MVYTIDIEGIMSIKSNALIKQFEENIRHTGETKLFQAWVDGELLGQVVKQRRKDGLSWRNLIESCFKLYLKISKDKEAT